MINFAEKNISEMYTRCIDVKNNELEQLKLYNNIINSKNIKWCYLFAEYSNPTDEQKDTLLNTILENTKKETYIYNMFYGYCNPTDSQKNKIYNAILSSKDPEQCAKFARYYAENDNQKNDLCKIIVNSKDPEYCLSFIEYCKPTNDQKKDLYNVIIKNGTAWQCCTFAVKFNLDWIQKEAICSNIAKSGDVEQCHRFVKSCGPTAQQKSKLKEVIRDNRSDFVDRYNEYDDSEKPVKKRKEELTDFLDWS